MPASAPPHRGDLTPTRAPAARTAADGWRPRLVLSGLHVAFEQLLRRGLRGVWLRGELPPGPIVLAANHHSWWDAFVLLAVLRQQNRRGALLMAGANLRRFPFLRRIGVLSTAELRSALAAVRGQQVLIVFPEGKLRAAGVPGPLLPGATWLAATAPATLAVAAIRVGMRGHQWPEAYVELQAGPAREDGLPDTLAAAVDALDRRLAQADPERPPLDFRQLVRGRRDWDERLSSLARRLRR
ncbi:MAG: 1-acyl-sn-glycerol-3-phosphate acyltransferase [Geodermatophilaceae bacterium]|nr:1-acyl-sn-glycerol-3-phosphate acyltransferase [Geodermatophilaceae bacterium]